MPNNMIQKGINYQPILKKREKWKKKLGGHLPKKVFNS